MFVCSSLLSVAILIPGFHLFKEVTCSEFSSYGEINKISKLQIYFLLSKDLTSKVNWNRSFGSTQNSWFAYANGYYKIRNNLPQAEEDVGRYVDGFLLAMPSFEDAEIFSQELYKEHRKNNWYAFNYCPTAHCRPLNHIVISNMELFDVVPNELHVNSCLQSTGVFRNTEVNKNEVNWTGLENRKYYTSKAIGEKMKFFHLIKQVQKEIDIMLRATDTQKSQEQQN